MRFAEFLKDQKIIKPANFIRQPLVSVIMPTYCRAHEGILTRSIRSVLSQTMGDFEFVIVDDGSVDGSQDVILDFQKQDNRILYIRHEINSGLPAVRVDEAILLSRGEYVAFEFDDDEWFPPFLRRVTEEARQRQRSFVFSQAEYVFGNQGYSPSFPAVRPTYDSLVQSNKIANAAVLLRRSILETQGLYNPHIILRRTCDWDLWLRILRTESPFLIPEVLVRINGGLPDSIGAKASWTDDIEDFTFVRRLFNDEDMTPRRILDFDVVSLDQYTGVIPAAKIDQFHYQMVLPWLQKYLPSLKKMGTPVQDIPDVSSVAGHCQEKTGRQAGRSDSGVRLIARRVKDRFSSPEVAWDDIPAGLRALEEGPSAEVYRNNGFSLRKSRDLRYANFLSYKISVPGSSLCSLRLAPAIDAPPTGGAITVDILSLDYQIQVRSVMPAAYIKADQPVEFFFEPPVKQGEYHLRIYGNNLTAPFRVYELVKGPVRRPYAASQYFWPSREDCNSESGWLAQSKTHARNQPPRILVTSDQRAASEEMGAIIPLSDLQKQGLCVFKYKAERFLSLEDIAWCDILFIIRGLSPLSVWAALQAKKHGRRVLGYWDDDFLNIPEYSSFYAYCSSPEVKKNIDTLFQLTDTFFSPNPKLASKISSACSSGAVLLPPPLAEVPFDRRDSVKDRMPVVGFDGSQDHIYMLDSLLGPVIQAVAAARTDFRLQVMGPKPVFLGQLQVESIHIPYLLNYYDYLYFSAGMGWDIGLAPQVDSEFAACKFYSKFLEYANIGCAGIYSKLEPYKNVVQDGVTGLLVDNEVEAWKEAVLRLLKDPGLRSRIAANAGEYVRVHHSRKVIAEQYAAALGPFLGRRAPRIGELYLARSALSGHFKLLYTASRHSIRTYGFRHFLGAASQRVFSRGRRMIFG